MEPKDKKGEEEEERADYLIERSKDPFWILTSRLSVYAVSGDQYRYDEPNRVSSDLGRTANSNASDLFAMKTQQQHCVDFSFDYHSLCCFHMHLTLCCDGDFRDLLSRVIDRRAQWAAGKSILGCCSDVDCIRVMNSQEIVASGLI